MELIRNGVRTACKNGARKAHNPSDSERREESRQQFVNDAIHNDCFFPIVPHRLAEPRMLGQSDEGLRQHETQRRATPIGDPKVFNRDWNRRRTPLGPFSCLMTSIRASYFARTAEGAQIPIKRGRSVLRRIIPSVSHLHRLTSPFSLLAAARRRRLATPCPTSAVARTSWLGCGMSGLCCSARVRHTTPSELASTLKSGEPSFFCPALHSFLPHYWRPPLTRLMRARFLVCFLFLRRPATA